MTALEVQLLSGLFGGAGLVVSILLRLWIYERLTAEGHKVSWLYLGSLGYLWRLSQQTALPPDVRRSVVAAESSAVAAAIGMLVFVAMSFQGGSHRIGTIQIQGAETSVFIRRFGRAPWESVGQAAVYGRIHLTAPREIERVNLGCFVLEIDGQPTNEVHVDRVERVEREPAERYSGNRRRTIAVRVYWPVRGKMVSELSRANLVLRIDEGKAPCIHFLGEAEEAPSASKGGASRSFRRLVE